MMTNQNAQIAKVNPEEDLILDDNTALDEYADKRRPDRNARLKRREQIKRGEVIDTGV